MQEALVRMAALHDLQQADILRAQVKAVTFLGVQVV
jgi:capsid protein